MNSVPRHLRRPLLQLVGAALLLLLSLVLLARHAQSVRVLRAEILPLAENIPQLERQLALLGKQLDIATMQEALRMDSPLEKVRAYALPAGGGRERLVASIEAAAAELRRSGDLSALEPLTFTRVDGPTDLSAELVVDATRLRMTLSPKGWDIMRSFLAVSGFVTVNDALDAADTQALLAAIEHAEPTGLAAVEQFLRSDLSAYAREADALDDALLASVGDDLSPVARPLLAAPSLQSAKTLFSSPLGDRLLRDNLWPLPLVRVRDIVIENAGGENLDVSVQLEVYGRKE